MQAHLFDPGPLDFSTERARDSFDDRFWGKPVLVWSDDGIMRKTAPYRGIWRGFRPDSFMGSIMGTLEESPGCTHHIGPLGIVAIREYDPLDVIEQRLERLLEAA